MRIAKKEKMREVSFMGVAHLRNVGIYINEDVCRLLNWENNEVPLNIGGYKYDKKTGTFPVFINYDKAEEIIFMNI